MDTEYVGIGYWILGIGDWGLDMMVHRLGSLLPIFLGVTVTEPTNGLLWNVLRFAQLPGEEHGAGHVLDHHRGLDRGSGVRPDGEHAVLFQQDGRRIPDALHYLAAYLLSPDGREAATQIKMSTTPAERRAGKPSPYAVAATADVTASYCGFNAG